MRTLDLCTHENLYQASSSHYAAVCYSPQMKQERVQRVRTAGSFLVLANPKDHNIYGRPMLLTFFRSSGLAVLISW